MVSSSWLPRSLAHDGTVHQGSLIGCGAPCGSTRLRRYLERPSQGEAVGAGRSRGLGAAIFASLVVATILRYGRKQSRYPDVPFPSAGAVPQDGGPHRGSKMAAPLRLIARSLAGRGTLSRSALAGGRRVWCRPRPKAAGGQERGRLRPWAPPCCTAERGVRRPRGLAGTVLLQPPPTCRPESPQRELGYDNTCEKLEVAFTPAQRAESLEEKKKSEKP
ncbi:uncharacterized protein LOC142823172 isoform X2 [Pelodiscus sinensis]|uniref:uncharacterized protein LOC142823172 isoform X2 n=1 Tax=Pelodiscus sinensis TaxID=13735 RepID=UPI003F6BD05C